MSTVFRPARRPPDHAAVVDRPAPQPQLAFRRSSLPDMGHVGRAAVHGVDPEPVHHLIGPLHGHHQSVEVPENEVCAQILYPDM